MLVFQIINIAAVDKDVDMPLQIALFIDQLFPQSRILFDNLVN